MSYPDAPEALKPDAPPLRSIEDRNALVLANKGLVYTMLRRLRLDGHNDRDDLAQAACVALIEAAERWDESHGAKFSTFACWYIRGHLLAHLNQRASLIRRSHIPGKGYSPAHKITSLVSEVAQPEPGLDVGDQVAQREFGEVLDAALRRLPQTYAEVLRRWHLGEETLQQIARSKGVTKERIRQIAAAACEKLRRLAPQLELYIE